MSKLTIEKKIEIAFSNKSTRELGVKYGVHHSTPANIKKEAKSAVFEYFGDKTNRIGRPGDKIFLCQRN